MATTIAVYADWKQSGAPVLLGSLHVDRGAGREVFSFEFDSAALADPALNTVRLDPRLEYFVGRQYPTSSHETFGMFADASPDRWGRLLMRRRLERDQRAGRVPDTTKLRESDYLLGVHDEFRAGALRLRREPGGGFLDDRHSSAAPPLVQLRALQAASLAIERDEENTAAAGDDWLRMLLIPGGSLGGARPKASVADPGGRLWIAKFPSARDEHDVGGWEFVLHTLAGRCGIRVTSGVVQRFASRHHTFLVRRFDRSSQNRRLHFSSAMNLTGHKDGDDASTGASYLEIAKVLMEHGSRSGDDLPELWTRIVFNLLVSNTDDHLRNHGFLLDPGKGWRLSEAYDLNPVPEAHGLRLNISNDDNAMDLDLVLSVAPHFRVPAKRAGEIVAESRRVVRQWRTVADTLGIPAREQARMAGAFRLAD
jgi:serine/threonine-protein kinase HipA